MPHIQNPLGSFGNQKRKVHVCVDSRPQLLQRDGQVVDLQKGDLTVKWTRIHIHCHYLGREVMASSLTEAMV
jgi:hypothetical protein